jgi:hypothetical protein
MDLLTGFMDARVKPAHDGRVLALLAHREQPSSDRE